MDKYRLKEEVKKYFKRVFWDREETKLWWNENSSITIENNEALEQVIRPIKLEILRDTTKPNQSVLFKTHFSMGEFSEQERAICEKLLNLMHNREHGYHYYNELLDGKNFIDLMSIDDHDFEQWYLWKLSEGKIDPIFKGVKKTLKKYLKDRI